MLHYHHHSDIASMLHHHHHSDKWVKRQGGFWEDGCPDGRGWTQPWNAPSLHRQDHGEVREFNPIYLLHLF